MQEAIELPYQEQTTLEKFDDPPRDYSSTPDKRTYKQNWTAYNLAQTSEKFMSLKILSDYVDSMNIKTYGHNTGRPPLPMGDMIKCCCIKVFNDFSCRRTIPEIELAHILRYIEHKPHFNSITNYMNNPYMTRFLKELIKNLSLPLIEHEIRFAADATGFSTFCKDKWASIRLSHSKHRDYKKLHAICGVNTNIITSVKVTEGKSADSPQFKELLNDIAKQFTIKEVSADAGYLSRENTQAIEDKGAVPYIKIKKNTRALSKGYPAWNKMVNRFKKNKEKFKLHYAQRSNIESTFAMIKRKFSPFIRSKNNKAQENEILCKVVCHNIAVLVMAIFELDIKLEE